ncbi:MAG: MBL fold metallo-hydrolase [Bacteroidota bacterium]|nr:MBL fold metallo-hydrolase [Bacteroidota bacterium]
MKVRFLGTGTSQGVPVIGCHCKVCQSSDPRDKRLRSSILIQYQKKNIIIDTGPDFRQQMLNADLMKIDAVLYTHEHRDHIAGMDDLRSFNFMTKMPIELYAEKQVQNALKTVFPYVFSDNKYPGVPDVNLHNIDENPFTIEGIQIIPIRVMHYRLPILGFRIGNFTYITDAKYISPEEKKKIIGSKVIVINALRKQSHISHFSLSEAVEFIKEFSPRAGYITHISHQLGKTEAVEKELPENIFLAFDGLEINLD